MDEVQVALIAGAIAFVVYTYLGYPLLLRLVGLFRQPPGDVGTDFEWPVISVTVPAYNEESAIRGAIQSLLEADYPEDKRQILVVSDGSTDRTEEIVAGFAEAGVELLSLPERVGKTAAENAAHPRLRGEIIVNTDASVRVHPDAVRRLVASFSDPSVGVASGRDVSVGRLGDEDVNAGESGYVGYDMWVRDLETRVSGIVGASGCLYAIRSRLHKTAIPDGLARDFASVLNARKSGYRAVSVRDAICFVPRVASLRREYQRKVRTMTRGLQTLFHERHLMNPFRYGTFAWVLVSHKLCRWLVPWAALVALAAVALLAVGRPWAPWFLAAATLVAALTSLGWFWPDNRSMPRPLAVLTYLVVGNVAAIHAMARVLLGSSNAVWEPTRRDSTVGPGTSLADTGPAAGGSAGSPGRELG